MTTPARAWLIDASIYIFRAWFSFPDRWHSDEGCALNAVYGYSKFLIDLIENVGVDSRLAAAFDESLGTNYRNDIYPGYKSSRELPDEELAFQLSACREITELLGIPSYGCDRFEADDYLASLARCARKENMAITVVTRDKDLGQIVLEEHDRWWDFAADQVLDRDGITARFGVRPDQLADYLALVGDPIDDVPGVPGVGAKTAAKLLQAFENLDHLGCNLSAVAQLEIRGAAKTVQRLEEHWEQVLLARQLTVLDERVPAVKKLPEHTLRAAHLADAGDFLESLNIGGVLLDRFRGLSAQVQAR